MRPLDAVRAGYDEITHINFIIMQAMPQAVVDKAYDFLTKGYREDPEALLKGALFTVTLPIAAPGLIASAIFVFLESLDEFTGTYFVGVPDVTTLPSRIQIGSGSTITSGFRPIRRAHSTPRAVAKRNRGSPGAMRRPFSYCSADRWRSFATNRSYPPSAA